MLRDTEMPDWVRRDVELGVNVHERCRADGDPVPPPPPPPPPPPSPHESGGG